MGQNVNDIIIEVFTLIEVASQKSDLTIFKIAGSTVQISQYNEPLF